MATFLKDPPSFVTNIGAWEYTLAKLANKQADDGKKRLDDGGNPLNYGQAVAIYKAVVKKYPAFQTPNIGTHKAGGMKQSDDGFTVSLLIDEFPVGELFWYDDVLCEAVAYGESGFAVYPDEEGKLFIRGKVMDVDPLGKHKDWPVEVMFIGLPAHRCAHWSKA